MRSLGGVLLATVLSGCIGFGGCRISFAPLAVEPSGAMLADPDGGPAVECRGLATDQCDIGFSILDPLVDERTGDPTFDVGDVDRIVVACVGACDANGGETRIDLVFANGTSQLYANGGYGEFEQSCA